MKWVYQFINSANFRSRNQKTFVTIIQFSGIAQAIGNYTPGGAGVAVPGTDDIPPLYHWELVEPTFKKPSLQWVVIILLILTRNIAFSIHTRKSIISMAMVHYILRYKTFQWETVCSYKKSMRWSEK